MVARSRSSTSRGYTPPIRTAVRSERVLAAEGENLGDELPGALRDLEDLLQVLIRRAVPGTLFLGQLLECPMIALRMLLKSWAMPLASVPIASIFCRCSSCCSSRAAWASASLLRLMFRIVPS